jgi:hypothetical protein
MVLELRVGVVEGLAGGLAVVDGVKVVSHGMADAAKFVESLHGYSQ